MINSNEKRVIEVSKIEIQGRLHEEIYNSITGEAKFVYYDEKEDAFKEVSYVEDGNIQYAPLIDDYVKKKVVFLPTQALPYESEEKLLGEIQSFIHKYVDISEEDEKICTWTIPMFFLYDKLNITIPYLRVLGDTGCGKSRFLDVIGGISYKPILVGGSVTPAILYRVTEKWKGTMVIDEADWKNTDEYSEVIKIINCNSPNRRILRCKGDNYDVIEAFDSWCARIFATRRNFYDIATESRMLTIQMKETSRDDIPIALNDEFYEKQIELRNKLLTYRLKNWSRVNSGIKPEIDFTDIEPRTKQIMYPIAIVFNHRKEILDELSEIMRKRQGELIKDRSSTLDGVVVNVYLELLGQGHSNITASDIVDLVKSKGYDINSQSVGHHMRSLGFTSTVKNIGGVAKRCYNYDEVLVEKLHRRYSLEYVKVESDKAEKLQRLQRLQQKKGWQRIVSKLRELSR